MTLTQITLYVTVTIYANLLDSINEALFWPNRQSFTGWDLYLSLGIPDLVIYCSSLWAYEIMILMSGLISVNAQAAYVLLVNIDTQIYMVSHGFQEATCVVIGNAIGGSNPALARKYFKMAIPLVISFSIVNVTLLYIFKEDIIGLFT